MPSFDIGPTRAVGAVDNRLSRETRQNTERAPQAATKIPGASVHVLAGQPPVDTDRVAEIRKAVEEGTYPIVPAKVADAMIAAGMILRAAK